MATLGTIRRRIEALNTDEVIAESFRRSIAGFTEWQKRQLYEGFNKRGERLVPYVSAQYAKKKNKINSNPGLGHPDLFLTGAFYEGIEVKLSGYQITVESRDEKGPDLKEKYDPFGLGGQYKQGFVKEFYNPNFRAIIKEQSGL